MKLFVVKSLSGTIKPAYDSDYESLKKMKAGEVYECEIKMPRNVRFHRKFFALINLVYQNQEIYTSIEHLRKDLIIASGHYETRFNFEGVEITEAKSISFAKMDEAEFNDLYSSVVDTICKHFHFDKTELVNEVAQYF